MAIVALVGRPNVGKSALFNRMTESRRAIVEDVPGVTRDRLYEDTQWNGRFFTLVDTGGIWISGGDDDLLGMTKVQTEIAINEAQVIVFVVDGQAGPTTADFDVLEILRKTRKPVILAVNKAESHKTTGAEFYEFGLDEPVLVSAIHGEGTGDLLDRIALNLPPEGEDESARVQEEIRIALAGRPNVGKSSLLNTLTGEERTLVTPIPGTTRDVVDSVLQVEDQRYIILDTAGLRRPSKISDKLEEKTVQRTLDAIRKADVVLLMLAANEPITAQDQRIAGQIQKAGKGCVVLLNKSDLVKGTTVPIQKVVREELKFLNYSSVIPVSVVTQWHLDRIWPAISEAYDSFTKRITTHQLNQLIQEAVHLNPPPTDKGRSLKIFYATQVSNKPPHFVLFVNDPELVHFSYSRYLENRLREKYGFRGSPIQLSFRPRSRRDLA
ncbi:MAG: ribosome biogenesis GTPase Der [Firmicutes bacterium]|uniref:GTPase Der n=1 Tax=Sulfobacillus benefaciens TaxID=453960 RepID=A0A2T2XB97_9FIRM|nr:ribosome biogenesis GTPase Der [Bacillota bacterium]MCL5015788.1 ribosome biogenesis GTPase Der [Bacillota bacterium]PSR31752.1 MAG: ribosome biogenesis GTPase Der [Sulfobacillus benefaciens]